MSSVTRTCLLAALVCLYSLDGVSSMSLNYTDLLSMHNDSDVSVSSLEEALATLSNLTLVQQHSWEQQVEHEKMVKEKNSQEEEREALRTKTMAEEHSLLKEIRGKFSRKLRGIYRSSSKNENAPDWLTTDVRPKDCAAIYLDGMEMSGVYRVWPTWTKEEKGFLVYCDMDTDGGGWTVIHRWSPSDFNAEFFRKTWDEYRNGFGDLDSDFWLGNDKIHTVTRQGVVELQFDFFLSGKTNASSRYERFWIDDETELFDAHVQGFKEDSVSADVFSDHNELKFSTMDKNNASPSQPTRRRECIHWNCEDVLVEAEEPCPAEKYQRTAWCYKRASDLNNRLNLDGTETKSSQPLKIEMKIRPERFSEMKEAV